MEAKDLKKYLLEDPERIEKVLEEYGFSQMWTTGGEIRCAPPGSENRTAAVIKLESELFSSVFSGSGFNGDLFGLLKHVSDTSFSDVIKNIHGLFGLSRTRVKKQEDLLAEFRKYGKGSSRKTKKENALFDASILKKYIMLPHISFLQEMISPDVIRNFKVCYDPRQDRVMIPHFDWNQHDKVVGLAGRTTLDSLMAKELGVSKYRHAIKGYLKTLNLFGWSHSQEYVSEQKAVVIFESEKSVMKHHTFELGKGFSVSVGGHSLSKEQTSFLIQNTSADTEIIIAFDKDVMMMKDDKTGEDIGEKYIVDICKSFKGMRKTSYIWDTYGVLNEKDSPIDRGVKLWKVFYEHRRRVNE